MELPTLPWHTRWVQAAADRLLDLRAGDAIVASGLPMEIQPRFERIVRFAAWLHDAGKCAESFQKGVHHQVWNQPFRHEIVSWYLAQGPLNQYLTETLADPLERWMVAACAAGHHRRLDQDHVIQDVLNESDLLLDHPDFKEWLTLCPGGTGIAIPTFSRQILKGSQAKRALEEAALNLEEGRPLLEDHDRRLLSLAKTFVIAADVAGSALPKAASSTEWIETALSRRATRNERDTLLAKKLKGQTLRPFQKAVADSSTPWTFLAAGCGTGKTAAACAWGAHQHVGRQLWLTYPTTGTATEGYRDYVLDADLEGALIHGRANLDLEFLETGENLKDKDESQVRDLAIRGWAADTVVATVDTVLGIMNNHRVGNYAYPGICKSALVFDELHAYDDRLFGCLLRFLEAHPGLPVLFMTASLPAPRFEALDLLCRQVHGLTLPVIPGPTELECRLRYHQAECDAWPAVTQCLETGGKVLWVSNMVRRAMGLADEAEALGLNPICYHSRFRYLDRLERHQAVIQAFNAPGSALACTTQVAEMSLDLSADLLVTDLAPIPALIQRLGRLNRRAGPGDPPRPFLVLEPETHEPYSPCELKAAQAWLDQLGAGPCSQADLVSGWIPAGDPPVPGASAWLDQPLWTTPEAIREPTPGISVVLKEDLLRIAKGEGPACAYQRFSRHPDSQIGLTPGPRP